MGDTVTSYPGHRPIPTPGSEIGTYKILDLLGSGGMGQVFLAEHKKLGRRVALKLLLPEFAGNPEVVARFFHEARAVNQINHEHIVEIVDFVEEPGGYNYFIMELLEGRDLAKARETEGPFLLGRTVHIIGQVASALAASHAKGIVHRDLKPENIFLVHRGEDKDFAKLLDFGIAKLSNTEISEKERPHTRAGMILGTPEYMSPEQAAGRPVDYRSDLYSLGVVTYWMLSDQLPYRGKSFGELMVKQLTTAPQAMPDRTPGGQAIPPAFAQLVYRCLEREPQKRLQSAGEIVEALGKFGGGGAAAARAGDSEPALELIPVSSGRPRWWLPAIAAAVGVVVGLLALWYFLGGGRDSSAVPPPAAAAAPVEAKAPAPLAPLPEAHPELPPVPAATPPVVAAAAPPRAAPAVEKPEASARPDGEAEGPPRGKTGRRGTRGADGRPASAGDNTGMLDPFGR